MTMVFPDVVRTCVNLRYHWRLVGCEPRRPRDGDQLWIWTQWQHGGWCQPGLPGLAQDGWSHGNHLRTGKCAARGRSRRVSRGYGCAAWGRLEGWGSHGNHLRTGKCAARGRSRRGSRGYGCAAWGRLEGWGSHGNHSTHGTPRKRSLKNDTQNSMWVHAYRFGRANRSPESEGFQNWAPGFKVRWPLWGPLRCEMLWGCKRAILPLQRVRFRPSPGSPGKTFRCLNPQHFPTLFHLSTVTWNSLLANLRFSII